jgi:hypothetical protein
MFEKELDRIRAIGGKSITGIEGGMTVLIVNWRSERLCWRESHMIDWHIKHQLPVIRERFRIVLHRADGDVMREVAA